jgi:imidazolonepropionase
MVPQAEQPYGLIEDAALVVDGETLAWVGPRTELPQDVLARCSTRHDAGGALVTPGLIDCHTHLVYGGDRANEFEMRLNGASYEEIARAGGGIASTVRATRAATEADLRASAARRLVKLVAEGVNTVEIKSGYGF